MRLLRKFLRYSPRRQWMLVKMAALLGVVRLGLWVLPFGVVRRLVARLSSTVGRPPSGGSEHDRHEVGWAVTVLGQRMLGSSPCLTQALALFVVYRRRGYPARLRIGVTKGEDGAFMAHAWLESRGKIVVGGKASDLKYTSFPPIEMGNG